METEIIKKRLKEAFGEDVQKTVAAKLCMSQSSISKMLSGVQLPTAEVLENVSRSYDVSVDWLLGLSDDRFLRKRLNMPTYGDAVKIILDLDALCAVDILMDSDEKICLKLKDPLLKQLLSKGNKLKRVDHDYYQSWRDKRLSEFNGKKVIDGYIWNESGDLSFYLREAENEEDLAEIYQMAIKKEQKYERLAKPDPGPFDK